MYSIIAVILGVFVSAALALWYAIGRPFAASRGMLPMTAYDHVVRGWKAERQGRWKDALWAYEDAIEHDPDDTDAHARRAALLEAHPELASAKK